MRSVKWKTLIEGFFTQKKFLSPGSPMMSKGVGEGSELFLGKCLPSDGNPFIKNTVL
jgi:hypothetical protein